MYMYNCEIFTRFTKLVTRTRVTHWLSKAFLSVAHAVCSRGSRRQRLPRLALHLDVTLELEQTGGGIVEAGQVVDVLHVLLLLPVRRRCSRRRRWWRQLRFLRLVASVGEHVALVRDRLHVVLVLVRTLVQRTLAARTQHIRHTALIILISHYKRLL